jgi:hypothetical protein
MVKNFIIKQWAAIVRFKNSKYEYILIEFLARRKEYHLQADNQRFTAPQITR